MLNYETLLSSYDDKLTLMQWLKKVEDALKDASAVAFNVNKRGDATLTFSVVFEDGTELETGPIVLEQGESVASAAIVGGHLKLTLTNGDVLDAGDLGGVSSFSIDASQHLIVHYQNGTTQDLGAIFSGNVTINGDLSVTGNIETDSMTPRTGAAITIDGDLDVSDGNVSLNDGYVSTPILTSQNASIEAQKPVVEVMTGYSYSNPGSNVIVNYAGACKNGNKITFVIAGRVTKASGFVTNAGTFNIPQNVADNLYPVIGNYVATSRVTLSTDAFSTAFTKNYGVEKISSHYLPFYIFGLNSDLAADTQYMFRLEVTFLLSENLAA